VNDARGVDKVKTAQQIIHDGLHVVLCQFNSLIHHAEQIGFLGLEHIVQLRK
jgi:hypothetical protein